MGDPSDAGARERPISESEFAKVLRDASPQASFFALLAGLPAHSDGVSRKHFWAIQEGAHQLETFLDNFHARNNRTYVLFAELVASIRNLAITGHTLGHVLVRFAKYGVEMPGHAEDGTSLLVAFPSQLLAATRFLSQSIAALIAAVHAEAQRVGVVPVTGSAPALGDSEIRDFRQHLPHDLVEERHDDVNGAVTVLLNQFLSVTERARRIRDLMPKRGADLRAFMTEHLGESEARVYKAAVHNLQSDYDTFVKPTQAHQRPELQRLRGHVSLAYHMLEVVNELVHFYERHEGRDNRGATQREIARLVPPEQVLEHAVHFALRYAVEATLAAEPLVRQLLPQFLQHDTLELALPDGVHLHARPLNLIVRIVRKHEKPVEIVVDGESASANSLMGLILFVGRHPQRRKYTFRGDRGPLAHLRLLFESGLGERGLEKLPTDLAYLRES